MQDLISRQAAIDALMAWEENSFWDEDCLEHRGEPFWVAPSDEIKQLPSAQPERTGKWKVIANIECSCCGYMPQFDKTKPLYKFCPNCGAKMEEGD